MIDTFKHKGMRRRLVEEIRAKGIHNERVLEAIGKIPRHLFMDEALSSRAYEDVALPIGYNQTISHDADRLRNGNTLIADAGTSPKIVTVPLNATLSISVNNTLMRSSPP